MAVDGMILKQYTHWNFQKDPDMRDYLHILDETSCLCIFINGRADPDIAIVSEDDAGTTRQIVEVCFPAFDQGGRHI